MSVLNQAARRWLQTACFPCEKGRFYYSSALKFLKMARRMNQSGFDMSIVERITTPFYYYDMDLLQATLNQINHLTAGLPCCVHYALKANSNAHIISKISSSGLGCDLVSGGEIKAALEAGFRPQQMTFSGVGKTDWEIELGLSHEIGCFNVESVPELDIINQLAGTMGKTARVALRVNPDIDAHTHKFITTGTANDKFGISIESLPLVVKHARHLSNIHLRGLHFHIGSQITSMQPYVDLCKVINNLLDHFHQSGIDFEMINVGGGLGIDYLHPDTNAIPDFKTYFKTFGEHLKLRPNQMLHFELGRSIVGQCGTLIARVVFVKETCGKKFVILDAGMTDLIRPALYGAYHEIQNLSSSGGPTETYNIVGPVCESTDVFARARQLPVTSRGDIIAIRSAGAYGESMASRYNMRPLPGCIFSSET